MVKRIISLSCFLTFSLFAMAQIPSNVHTRGGAAVNRSFACNNLAGTSRQLLRGQQQSKSQPIYLCFGDTLTVLHNGDFAFPDDPVPVTAPGIGYVFYDCKPTVSGTTASDIKGDRCTNHTSPIIINSIPINQLDSVWIASDNINNSLSLPFINNGLLQNAYNSGSPVRFFFAPVTLDDFRTRSWEAFGPCVNANISDAFEVVYLNAIKASNQKPGEFRITGGLPEWDGNQFYTVSIVKSGKPSVTGTVTNGQPKNNSTVTYSVPEAGTYDITVTDSKSCSVTFQQLFSAAPLVVKCSSVTGKKGQTVCVDVTVDNFVNMITMSGTFNWDTTVMKYNSIQIPGNIPDLNQGTFGTIQAIVNRGKITLAWGAPADSLLGITRPNGTLFCQLCFTIDNDSNTNPGDSTLVTFDGSLTPIEIKNVNGDVPLSLMDGKVKVVSGSLITVDLQPTSASCKNFNDGRVRVTVSGGNPPYAFRWQLLPAGPVNGPQNIATNGGSSTVSNLAPGTYSFTVTDASGEVVVQTVEVKPAGALGANLVIVRKPSCNGFKDGIVAVEVVLNNATVSNPGPEYSFRWNTGSTNDTITGINAGPYSVFVFKNNGNCIDTAIAAGTLSEPSAINLILNKVDVSCTPPNVGSASVSVSGGTSPYIFRWNDPAMQTTPIANNLAAGTYRVTVTDNNGCKEVDSVRILPPNSPVVDSIIAVNIKCFGAADGTVTVFARPGGSPISNYAWSNGRTGATVTTINNLAAGTYTVTVTAQDGCSTTARATVNEPAPLQQDSVRLDRPRCPTGPLSSNGAITVFISGGVKPYQYFWSTNPGTPTSNNLLPGLAAGNYGVTVVDANGCRFPIPVINLQGVPALNVTFPSSNIQNVKCFDGVPCDGQATAVASGGNDVRYQFVWSSGEIANNVAQSGATKLCQGTQSVTVTDGFCVVVANVNIGAPPPIVLDTPKIVIKDANCFGSRDGKATVEAKGGFPPYSYLWPITNQQGGTLDKIGAGTYSVVVTDVNGCKDTFDVTVNQPQPMVAAVDLSNSSGTKCSNTQDGRMSVTCTNCQTPVTYLWPGNISTTRSADNLKAGNYVVTIVDAKGCSDTARYFIFSPPPVQALIPYPDPPECFGYGTNINVDSAYGGLGKKYTFSVDESQKQPIKTPFTVYAGTHVVKVFDSVGCFRVDTLVILEPPKIVVNLGPDTTIQLGDSVQLTPQIISVLPIDSMIWIPLTGLVPSKRDGMMAPFAKPSEKTTYKLNVFDSNKCPGTGQITIDVDRLRNVFIPNVFTPDSDQLGDNAAFRIFTGPGVVKINYTRIYDRWGELLYEDLSGNPRWDGNFKGKRMNPGVYVYIAEVTFLDGLVLQYKGDVTLLR